MRLSRVLPLFGLAVPSYWMSQSNRRVDCCGIIGVLTTKGNAEQVVMEGVHLLENRGYDSAGIVTVQTTESKEQKLVLSKYASDAITKVDCFEKIHSELHLHKNAMIGVGHTRWATCGAKVDMNAHPHTDMRQRVALVHNGTLENFMELKQELVEAHGVQFTSQTDSEVIAQWIGVFLESGMPLLEATEKALTKLHGQWGLVVIDKENPDVMIACRQGSPILVGYNSDSIFVASEKIAFEKYTSTFIQLKDGEIIQLKLSDRNNFYAQVKHRMQTLEQPHVPVSIKPQPPYRYFFEQEIFEQPSSTLRCLGNGGRLAGSNETSKLGGFEMFQSDICSIQNLILLGCGSSYLAAQAVVPYYRSLHIFDTVSAFEGSEFNQNDISCNAPGVIVISQSGETKDLITALEIAKQKGAFSIGIVNVVGSVLGTTCDCGVFLNCGREVGVAASKSFTSQIQALILVALWMSYNKEKLNKTKISFKQVRIKTVDQLRCLPMSIGQGLHECHPDIQLVAKVLLNYEHLLILGKGPCSAIAKEGALKIKELTYKHAEGFSAGELKHGPLALIDQTKEQSMPILLIVLDNEYLNDMKLALSEVHSRNALTIVITDCPQKLTNDQAKIHHMIKVPFVGQEVGWLLAVLPFQLLALELCILMGINPDKPRNLAKTVTVG